MKLVLTVCFDEVADKQMPGLYKLLNSIQKSCLMPSPLCIELYRWAWHKTSKNLKGPVPFSVYNLPR